MNREAKEVDTDIKSVEEDVDDLDFDNFKLGAEATSRKTLILLDFNGTLAHREKIENSLIQKRAHYKVRYCKFYIRPGARQLVCRLLNDPRCEVAVYTSIMKKNIWPVISEFDAYFQKMSQEGKWEPVQCGDSVITTHSSMQQGILTLFDQEYNSSDPEGENYWDTIRDLNKIWKAPQIRSMKFDATNTLLIDAEARKVRKHKENSVVIPEYTGRHVVENVNDRSLLDLAKYLDCIMIEMQDTTSSIPAILQREKFQKSWSYGI